MAEVVQRRLEERLPELEQLERGGLLSGSERRAIIKKVTALEHKVHRRALSKENFISYIQYEINLLELIKKRRARVGYTFKKEEIEYAIVNRIHGVFSRALTKWKGDIQLWLSHVAFCKKWNAKVKLSKVFSAMLAIHPDKPALWIMAAKWEMEDRLSSENARHLFLRALRFHPDSQKLYQEYFRMELMHAEKVRKEKDLLEAAKLPLAEAEYPEEIVRGDLARIVYKNGIQKILGDAEFHLSFWTIAVLFSFTTELQKEIVEDLQAQHANHALTWDFMARRELDAESLPTGGSKQGKASDIIRREQRCWAVYEEALVSVPTEAVWKCYITFCLERLKRKTNNKDLREERLRKVLSLFDRATDASLLPPVLYKRWDSLSLWLLYLDWSERAGSVIETESRYQHALQTPIPAICVTMKERYLDWALRAGGYKKARRVFTSLQENRPLSLEFFRKMIAIEKEQECSKMQRVREYYERALREFGSTSADLWLGYIAEEQSHSQGKPEHTGQIHWRAMKTLQGEQVERFVSQYTLLQAGCL
uniref:U3 small nucleolar RNA-associated protein 6 homolog isoform X2 n=1 Tax=Pristiophorus japonicus TaxID=55135 RepID=UPI00398EA5E3